MKRISDKNKPIQRADANISVWQQNNTYNADEVVYDALHNHIVKRVSIDPAETTETTPPSESSRWTLVNSVPVWAANINYPLNFILEQGGILYKCNNAHTSTTFVADSANWTAISAAGGIITWDMTPTISGITSCVYPFNATQEVIDSVFGPESNIFPLPVTNAGQTTTFTPQTNLADGATNVQFSGNVADFPLDLSTGKAAFELLYNFDSGGLQTNKPGAMTNTLFRLMTPEGVGFAFTIEQREGTNYAYVATTASGFPVITTISGVTSPILLGVLIDADAGTFYLTMNGTPVTLSVGGDAFLAGSQYTIIVSAVESGGADSLDVIDSNKVISMSLFTNFVDMEGTYPEGTSTLCGNGGAIVTLPSEATAGSVLEVSVPGSYGGEPYLIGDIAIVKADSISVEKLSNVAGSGAISTWYDTYTVRVGSGVGDDFLDIIALNAHIVQNLISGRVLNICFDGGAITANDALIYQPQFKEINIIAGNDPLDDVAWVPVNSPLESLTVINAGNQIINFAGVWTINSIYLDKVNLIGGPTNPSSITFNGSSAFHRCNASYNMTITSTFEDVMIYDPSGHWIITGTFITRVHGHVNCDAVETDGRVFFTRVHGSCDAVYHTAFSPISSPFIAVEQSYIGIGTVDIGSNLVDEGLSVYSAVAIVGNVMGTPNVSVFNQTPNIATANGMIYAAGDGSGNYPQVITYTTSRTSVHDDVGKYIRYDSATDVTYSIDQEGTLFPLGGEIHIEQVNTGKVTIDVALLSDGEIVYESLFVPTTRGQRGVITIKKTVHGATRADDKFTVFGALEEAPI